MCISFFDFSTPCVFNNLSTTCGCLWNPMKEYRNENMEMKNHLIFLACVHEVPTLQPTLLRSEVVTQRSPTCSFVSRCLLLNVSLSFCIPLCLGFVAYYMEDYKQVLFPPNWHFYAYILPYDLIIDLFSNLVQLDSLKAFSSGK